MTLLVCSKRTTSLAASWTVGSKVVTQCWISVCISGISSCNVGCGGCRTSERAGGFGGGGVGSCEGAAGAEGWLVSSSVVFLRARRAVPSAGAGE